MTSPTNTKSKTSFISLFLVLLLLCTSGVIGYYVLNQNHTVLNMEKQSQNEASEKEKKPYNLELQVLFDDYLNDFKNDLRGKATDYKSTRSVLNDIKSPYNFETVEYAKENHDLFKKSIAPSLRLKASETIDVFDIYNKKIEENLKDNDNNLQQTFVKKWKEMHQKQLTKYIEFFSKEEEIIQAHDDLITFYYVHSHLYEVDTEANEFIFSREKDEKKSNELLGRIDTLQNAYNKKK